MFTKSLVVGHVHHPFMLALKYMALAAKSELLLRLNYFLRMKRAAQWILVLTLAAHCCAGQSSDDSTLKVEVKLVNVFATVTDGNGAPVAGLKREDFQILEDGVPQSTAIFARQSDLPLSIVLAIDSSLSTRDDLKFELRSARGFAHH